MSGSNGRRAADTPRRPAASRTAASPTIRTRIEREASLRIDQEAANERDLVADRREKAADRREISAMVEAQASAVFEAQMREANERLVVAAVQAQAMAEAAEKAAEQIAYMVEHDHLTGLPNRVLLADRLAQSIALAQRHGNKVALLFLDLDHFKHINDSLGHSVGDSLLQLVAQRLQTCVRLSDTVSRQGGDEFVVLLADINDVKDAVLTAEKLIESMTEPYLVLEHRLHATVSIGISLYPDDGDNAATLIRNADTAMYQAKKKERNNYQIFTPDMNARAMERQLTEKKLHHALEEGEFVLHYQSKVNLVTGTITGAEALIRLQPADGEIMHPVQFVGIAEDCGLILPIGSWVLREACRQAQEWLESGLELGQISVNVSIKQVHHKHFVADLRNILSETRLDPGHLEVELTESVMMLDTDGSMSVLHALKDLGVKIAIDDFGTGYSSLNYLRRFPIDTLKIDQSFVKDIDGEGGEVIVSAIIAMGMSLRQHVVAEGIETPQQLAFLQAHHCAEGQGFLLDVPMPAAQFAGLLLPGVNRLAPLVRR